MDVIKTLKTPFTLFSAACRENPKNSTYNTQHTIKSSKDLKAAVATDYVCATYSGNKRSNRNFVSSDCLAFDCDNTHTDDSDAWITPEKLRKSFPSVCMALHFSRNNMKQNRTLKLIPPYLTAMNFCSAPLTAPMTFDVGWTASSRIPRQITLQKLLMLPPTASVNRSGLIFLMLSFAETTTLYHMSSLSAVLPP